jgi:2-dehydro-3-deoxyphosphooctonate aldolase (KDO 8-P synthase)
VASGGEAEFIPLVVRTGVAAGADGLFLEVHENPAKALSDGPNSLILNKLEAVLRSALRVRKALREEEGKARS